MKKWITVGTESCVIQAVGGFNKEGIMSRLIGVLTKAYHYTFTEDLVRIYPDYFEFVSPDGNEPTRKEKTNFSDLFLKEFPEAELAMSEDKVNTLFHYNKSKADQGSEKLRKLYDI